MTTDPHDCDDAVHALSGGKLDELELLAGGLLSPADGYCLPSSVPENWPAPFTLEVPLQSGHKAIAQGFLLLTDPDGTPLAHLAVDGSLNSEAEGTVFLSGTISQLRDAEHPPARRIRITSPLRPAAGGPVGEEQRPVLAAVFSETPRLWQLAAAMSAALDTDSALLLVALCGPQPHGRYTASGLVHELESAAARIDGARAGLVVLPADPAAASPRDLVVQEHVLARIGAHRVLNYIADGEGAPSSCQNGADTRPRAGTVVLLTGLSGSGKSTVARALTERLQQQSSLPVTLLDGDEVRRILSPGLGFSRADRELNIERIGWVASLVSATGGIAICAPIAPFDKTRQQVRDMAERVGGFLLIHISTPLSVCEARDRKGLYAKARRGEVKDFTGIDSPYEYPHDAQLHLDTSKLSISEAVAVILRCLVAPDASRPKPARTFS